MPTNPLASDLDHILDLTRGLSGRIDAAVVLGSVPDPLSVTYYLSGPPEMIGGLTSGLSQRGATHDRIVADAWE